MERSVWLFVTSSYPTGWDPYLAAVKKGAAIADCELLGYTVIPTFGEYAHYITLFGQQDNTAAVISAMSKLLNCCGMPAVGNPAIDGEQWYCCPMNAAHFNV